MSENDLIILSVEQVRAELLRGIKVPPALTNRALEKLAEKLEAQETKHFTHKGRVIETAVVEDHAAQLSAIDKVLSISGLYSKDLPTEGGNYSAIEITPDGVVRILNGPRASLPPAASLTALVSTDTKPKAKVQGPTTRGVPDEVWDVIDSPPTNQKGRVVHDEVVE